MAPPNEGTRVVSLCGVDGRPSLAVYEAQGKPLRWSKLWRVAGVFDAVADARAYGAIISRDLGLPFVDNARDTTPVGREDDCLARRLQNGAAF